MPTLKSAMPNGFNIQNPPSHIPTYLPLTEAARRHGLSEKVLTQLIQTGKIGAVQLSSGEVFVAADNNNGQGYKTKAEIIATNFANLRGHSISASEASRKYSEKYKVPISNQNFSHWAKAGYIKVLDRGYRLQLDEADVAYCAKIYTEKYREYDGQMSGVPIFDEEGNPYQLKYEELAERKRTSRWTQKMRIGV